MANIFFKNCNILFFTSVLSILSVIVATPMNNNENRLFSGIYAKRGQFPFTVTIKNKEDFMFGGSLISTNIVLTSASEVLYKAPLMVYMGTVKARDAHSLEGVVVNTSNYVVHKKFDSVDHQHDIALLFLAGHFYISGLIEPIRLPSRMRRHESFEGEYATLSGVGMTTSGSGKKYMQFLKLRVISNAECKDDWRLSELFPTQMCTRSRGSKIGPCHGDQGGPLIVEESDGIRTQIALSSLFNCGRDHPHLYTRLSEYIDWIAQNGGPPVRKGDRTDIDIYNMMQSSEERNQLWP